MTDEAAGSPVARALVGAALIIGASAALSFASPQYISDELARRLVGVMLGLVVVIFANSAPKALTPFASMNCDPATEQALRRFTAWAIVVGGLGFAAIWMFAPLETVKLLSITFLGSALVLVALRYSWVVGVSRMGR
jgi:hypothetical protein